MHLILIERRSGVASRRRESHRSKEQSETWSARVVVVRIATASLSLRWWPTLFQVLDVGISIDAPGDWYDIYARPFEHDLLSFELEHGVEVERVEYNRRRLAKLADQKNGGGPLPRLHRSVRADRARAGADTVLVTGPFVTSRPTSRESKIAGARSPVAGASRGSRIRPLPERHALHSGARGCAGRCVPEAGGVSGAVDDAEGNAQPILAEVQALRKDLVACALCGTDVERLPRHGRRENEPRLDQPALHLSAASARDRALPRARGGRAFVNLDPTIGSGGRDDSSRRLSTRVCRSRACENTASGKVGGHGVTFLCPGGSSQQRTQRALVDLTEQAATLARREFGLGMHFGLSVLPSSLTEQYQTALAAAESAVSKGVRLVDAGDALPAENPLGALRRELGERVEENPQTLPARFDRYLEAVAVRCGYRLESGGSAPRGGFRARRGILPRWRCDGSQKFAR